MTPGPTTAAGPGNRWPSRSAPGAPARTRPPTTLRRRGCRWRSCPVTCAAGPCHSSGGTHEFLTWLTAKSRRLRYPVGTTITEDTQEAILKVPGRLLDPAYDGDGQVRDGAWVADITGLLDLSGWPAGMRVIGRKERPHPAPSCGSPTSTATASPPSPPTPGKASSPTWNSATAAGPAARTASGTRRTPGCGTCPLKGFAQNQLWCESVALACDLLAWTQLLALVGTARRWEPKRLRLRLFSVAGRLARSGPPAPAPAPAGRTLAPGRRDHRRGHRLQAIPSG